MEEEDIDVDVEGDDKMDDEVLESDANRRRDKIIIVNDSEEKESIRGVT